MSPNLWAPRLLPRLPDEEWRVAEVALPLLIDVGASSLYVYRGGCATCASSVDSAHANQLRCVRRDDAAHAATVATQLYSGAEMDPEVSLAKILAVSVALAVIAITVLVFLSR